MKIKVFVSLEAEAEGVDADRRIKQKFQWQKSLETSAFPHGK